MLIKHLYNELIEEKKMHHNWRVICKEPCTHTKNCHSIESTVSFILSYSNVCVYMCAIEE